MKTVEEAAKLIEEIYKSHCREISELAEKMLDKFPIEDESDFFFLRALGHQLEHDFSLALAARRLVIGGKFHRAQNEKLREEMIKKVEDTWRKEDEFFDPEEGDR